MQEIQSVTLAAMQQDAARLERISSNLANATTPAFKREVFVQRPLAPDVSGASFARVISQAVLQSRERTLAGATPAFDVVRDMRPGTLRLTRQPLDLALSGAGYFEVATDNGPAYTRQGQFEVDTRGRLVTPRGHPVMGLNGEIVLSDGQPTIDANGGVSEKGRVIAQIKVVGFDSSSSLQALYGGLYASSTPGRELPGTEYQVRQGYLEGANVSSMVEMVQLMQTMRHFESLQKAVQGYDEMLGTAIRKLGDL
jgi:flagellar basal-body rod protein FlgF